jgi:hypothetical protein
MKESLQEQLARLANALELKTNTPESKINPPTPIINLPNKTSINQKEVPQAPIHEEHEKLKTENLKLKHQLIEINSNLTAANDRFQNSEQKISILQAEILKLQQEISEQPDKNTVDRWRDDALNSMKTDKKNIEEKQRLELGFKQLEVDRNAFEFELIRLDQLDTEKAQLELDQTNIIEAQAILQSRELKTIQTEEHQAEESEKLLKKATLLKVQLEKIKGFKRIENEFQTLQESHTKLTRLYESSKTRIRNLTAERDQANTEQAEAEWHASIIVRKLKDAEKELALIPEGEIIIRSFETVKWLTSQFDDPHEMIIPKQILLIGDGPWPLDNFTELLQDLGFEIWQNGCDESIEVVVVGRENWFEVDIDNQITARDGKALRIYPQELFIALLAMQADPFEIAPEESLLEFVREHPLFDYLFGQEFPWPDSTYDEAPPATISDGFDREDTSSPLYTLGYSVAQQKGLMPSVRRNLLSHALSTNSLPWCVSDEYMDDWGQAGTRRRLRRIAWHLNMLARRSKKITSHKEAVAKWESDLLWLKKFYKPLHRFRWPS